MSKNYDDYKPINPAPPRKRRNPLLAWVQSAIIILLILSLVLSGTYFVVSHMNEEGGKSPLDNPVLDTNKNDDTTDDSQTEPDNVPVTPPEDAIKYVEIDVSKSEINKGSLILVNGDHRVVYPAAGELARFDGNKSNTYVMSMNGMLVNVIALSPINNLFDAFSAATGKNNVTIWTSYRDAARQAAVYDAYVNGKDDPTARAGSSDHNTGLGIVLVVQVNGVWKSVKECGAEYSWLIENAHKYGFIERHPDDKIDITGLDYSQRYYIRYVGVAHSEYMKKNNLCLEEYINVLKGYPHGTNLEFTTDDGTEYSIYYVNGNVEGDMVKVPVPEDKEYTISGNNVDGFVVSFKK